MKTLILCLFTLSLTSLSLANHHEEHEKKMKGKTFQEKKSFVLKRVEKRMQIMSDLKNCVSSSTNEQEIKSCHQEAKSKRKGLKKLRKNH